MLRLEEHISSSKPEDTLLLVIGHIFTHMLQPFRLRRPSGGPPDPPAGIMRGCGACWPLDWPPAHTKNSTYQVSGTSYMLTPIKALTRRKDRPPNLFAHKQPQKQEH